MKASPKVGEMVRRSIPTTEVFHTSSLGYRRTGVTWLPFYCETMASVITFTQTTSGQNSSMQSSPDINIGGRRIQETGDTKCHPVTEGRNVIKVIGYDALR